ncbi:MAG: hypothetical protein FWF56_02575 [Firmicutes bacterium]|nr:hypothetical protein [Bacillota bacterium]MCL1953516.1 hypothetical protein [Bacillota bacterium]
MREDYINGATIGHLYYGMAMHDFASSICLSVSNADRYFYVDLYKQIEKWQQLIVDCLEYYTLCNIDYNMFFSDCTHIAIKRTMQQLNIEDSTGILVVEKKSFIPKKFVGKLTTIHSHFVGISLRAKILAKQLSQIVDNIIHNYSQTTYCALPQNILKYISSSIINYDKLIEKLNTKQSNMALSTSYLEEHASYLFGQLISCGHPVANNLSIYKFHNSKFHTYNYYLDLQQIVCKLVFDENENKTCILPLLADHFLRYSCAYNTMSIFSKNLL